jgi:hypothetical protein
MTDLERLELVLRTVKAENPNLDTLTNTEFLTLLIEETCYRNQFRTENDRSHLEQLQP